MTYFLSTVIMNLRYAREWMYKMDTPEFYKGVEEFIKHAACYFHALGFTDGTIKCPCKACQNIKWRKKEDAEYDLCICGFIPDYYIWTSHGE